MNKFFMLLFLFSTNIIASELSECKIMAIGGIIEKKDANPYFILTKENIETYFSIRNIRFDNCHLSISEILTRKIKIDQNNIHIKKDRECEIEGYLTTEKNLKETKLLLSSVNYLFNIRANATIENNYIKTKIQLRKSIKGRDYLPTDEENNRKFKEYTEGKNLYSEYITYVLAIVNNQTIFNLEMSKNFAENPVIKFKFNSMKNARRIEIITINNNGLKRRQEVPIFQSKTTRITSPVILEESKVKDAVEKLSASAENSIKEKINLIIPEPFISCQSAIPIHITSNIDLESIAIFTDKTPNPVVAIFSNPSNGIIDYKFNIQIHNEGDSLFTVIGKGRDGKIYKTVKKSVLPRTYDGCL